MKDNRMTVKSRLLEILEQHKGEVLSGEHLAQELNCTRAAIWKGVKSLREEGHRIQAGPNKGYMLEADSNRLSVEGLKLYLAHPDVMVRLYDSVPSTNQAAKLAAVSGDAGHGSLVAALEQTEGRGRRGRSFCSPREAGLYFSVVLHPGESLQESLLITTAAAVAVYKAVLEVCGISLGIKWVNDLFKDGKTSGQEDGGFAATASSKNVNWIITPRKAPIAVSKTDKMRIFDPETNQKARAYAMDYRKYHDIWIPDEQVATCFVNVKEELS